MARHARVSLIALLVCLLLSGKALEMIDLPALAAVAVAACLARSLTRFRQTIENLYLVGLPLVAGIGAATAASLQDFGAYLAFAVVGSVYGWTWFGLDPESRSPASRTWVTAIPVMSLGACFLALSMQPFDGAGLGAEWTIWCAIGVAVVALAATRLNAFAICSVGTAATLSIAVRPFQDLDRLTAIDVVMVFLPYAVALFLAYIRGLNPAPALPDLSHSARLS